MPAGSAFYTYIETARAHGAIGGYADGSFKPDGLVTRGQITKMVAITRVTATSS